MESVATYPRAREVVQVLVIVLAVYAALMVLDVAENRADPLTISVRFAVAIVLGRLASQGKRWARIGLVVVCLAESAWMGFMAAKVNDATSRTLFVLGAPLMSFGGAQLLGLFGSSWERAR